MVRLGRDSGLAVLSAYLGVAFLPQVAASGVVPESPATQGRAFVCDASGSSAGCDSVEIKQDEKHYLAGMPLVGTPNFITCGSPHQYDKEVLETIASHGTLMSDDHGHSINEHYGKDFLTEDGSHRITLTYVKISQKTLSWHNATYSSRGPQFKESTKTLQCHWNGLDDHHGLSLPRHDVSSKQHSEPVTLKEICKQYPDAPICSTFDDHHSSKSGLTSLAHHRATKKIVLHGTPDHISCGTRQNYLRSFIEATAAHHLKLIHPSNEWYSTLSTQDKANSDLYIKSFEAVDIDGLRITVAYTKTSTRDLLWHGAYFEHQHSKSLEGGPAKKSCTWPGSHKSPALASGKDIISKRAVSETSPVSSKHRVTKEAKVILKGRVLTGTPDSITCDGTVYDKVFLEQTMKKQAQRKRVVGQSPWPFGFDNHGYLYKGARFPAGKDKSTEIEIIYSSAKRHQLIWKAASFYHTGYHLPEDNLKKSCTFTPAKNWHQPDGVYVSDGSSGAGPIKRSEKTAHPDCRKHPGADACLLRLGPVVHINKEVPRLVGTPEKVTCIYDGKLTTFDRAFLESQVRAYKSKSAQIGALGVDEHYRPFHGAIFDAADNAKVSILLRYTESADKDSWSWRSAVTEKKGYWIPEDNEPQVCVEEDLSTHDGGLSRAASGRHHHPHYSTNV